MVATILVLIDESIAEAVAVLQSRLTITVIHLWYLQVICGCRGVYLLQQYNKEANVAA